MPPAQPTLALAGAIFRAAVSGRGPVAGPHLVRIDAPAADRAPLRDGLTIGRGRAATLRLALPEISRRHARIVAGPDGFAIADLGSKNGLSVNGHPVRSAMVPLCEGDVVALGGVRGVRLQVAGSFPGTEPDEPLATVGPHPVEWAGREGGVAAAALLLSAAALLAWLA